jgi:hypothetical protein
MCQAYEVASDTVLSWWITRAGLDQAEELGASEEVRTFTPAQVGRSTRAITPPASMIMKQGTGRP